MKLTIALKDGTTDFAYVSDETLDQLVQAIMMFKMGYHTPSSCF